MTRGRVGLLVLVAAAVVGALVWFAPRAAGDPYRLRSDVFVSAEPPVGLLVLEAEDQARPWLDAEALVWAGADDLANQDGGGDALVVSLRAVDPKHRGEVRLGRFVLATGAVRPVHMDGIDVTGRAPWGTSLELFGGMPVVPQFGQRDYDWLVGSRLAQRLGDDAALGTSIYMQRDGGALSDSELGIDGSMVPVRWLDLAGRAAYDLVTPGFADVQLSAAARRGAWRYELYGTHRSPSRLLPATSLFSALGDIPANETGTAVTWRAAPRLDLVASGGARFQDGAVAELASLRGTLRLDDRGAGALGLEGRREGGLDAGSGWTGVRATCRVPLALDWNASSELELVLPDHPDGRGSVWPWGLIAVSWQPAPAWELAGALEASASAEHTGELSGLFRLTRRWGLPGPPVVAGGAGAGASASAPATPPLARGGLP